MWQRWYKHQCVAVGWASSWGFKLEGRSNGGRGWGIARKALREMAIGDFLVVALRGNRLGRLGQITDKQVSDDHWSPLVPIGPGLPEGEMGRRILVRWDLTIGPDNPDLVVQLPSDKTLSNWELRHTLSRIKSMTLQQVVEEMNTPSNWVSLLGGFRYEKALSDFIANYPGHLEDGLLPHPNLTIRERVFKDRTRSDVLLIDRQGAIVIVECKQHAPTTADIEQLRNYMQLMRDEVGSETQVRGILVHGGAAKLTAAVVESTRKPPQTELVNYGLQVNFRPSEGGT